MMEDLQWRIIIYIIVKPVGSSLPSCQILTKTKTAIYGFYGVRERGNLWPDLNHEDQNLPTRVGSPFKPIDIFIVQERKNKN